MKSMMTCLACFAMAISPVLAQSQPNQIQPLVAQPAQPAPTGLAANTPITLSMNDDLTTKGGNIEVGTTFNLTVTQDVTYSDYIVIPRGSLGIGEVTWKTGKGAFGKSGKMEVELRYVDVNGNHIPIVGKYRQEGEGNTVATIGAVVAVGVFGAFVTGKSARIPRGRELIAYTKEIVPVTLPADAAHAQ